MGEENLIGGFFYGCRFGRGGYSFEILVNRETFHLSTGYSASALLEDMLAKKDAGREISAQVWDLLETELTAIDQLESHHAIRLEFSQGGEIYIWSDDEPEDNLVVVRSRGSDEWFTIG